MRHIIHHYQIQRKDCRILENHHSPLPWHFHRSTSFPLLFLYPKRSQAKPAGGRSRICSIHGVLRCTALSYNTPCYPALYPYNPPYHSMEKERILRWSSCACPCMTAFRFLCGKCRTLLHQALSV